MVLDSDRRAHDRLGIQTRVVTVGHGDFGKRFRRCPGVMEIPHGGHAKPLCRRSPPPMHVKLLLPHGPGWWDWAAWRLPAHAPTRTAIHRTKDNDRLAVSGFEQPDGMANQCLRARPSTHDIE